jgi:hypothetical protein
MKTRRFRKLLLTVAILLVLLLGGMIVLLSLARADPDFYRPLSLTPEQRQAAAQRAENKLTDLQNRAARHRAAERAAARRDLNDPVTSITVSFTDDELNAFFEKWAVVGDWKQAYERYVEDPIVIVRDGRIILAGKVKELGVIASLHFEPRIDDAGMLDLRLVRVLGGRLPLPHGVIGRYETRLAAQLNRRLPAWQRAARFDESGAANSSAIAATLSKLLLNILRDKPTEPVLFLPVIGGEGNVPVRVTDLQLKDGEVTIVVEPMSHEQRAQLLARIRATEPIIADVNPGASH